MGATVASATVASQTVANEGDVKALGNGPVTVAFASMGTGPAVTQTTGGPVSTRLRVTVGTGAPAIAANNVQVTCPRPPRRVFLAASNATPGYHVASISGSVINIGTKVAPTASSVDDLELIVLY